MSAPPPRPRARPQSIPPGLPAAGQIFAGKYEIERLLGLGGMGAVLAARHVELDERVAIKMLLPSAAPISLASPQAETVARFVREARAAIKIRNEHVVRILDVARLEDGAPYIVMEYLEGSDLARLAEERGPLPVEDAIDYVVQACEAIGAAHAMGIVHRDLKPANLFLTRTGDGRPCVKVLDFGISKIGAPGSEGGSGGSSSLTSTATIMGTPCFMSPEQLRATRDVDARADIWSLGAILHALLTGNPPYDGESNADVSAKIIRDAPTPLREVRADVPPALEALVLRCLEKDPAARYADVPALVEALASVTTRDSVRAGAARAVRSSLAAAPTQASLPPAPGVPAASVIVPAGGAASGPTRTASAWGETGREQRKGRKEGPSKRGIAAGVAALALITIGAAGVTRWAHPSASTPVATGSTPGAASPGVAASTPPPASEAPASAGPSSSAGPPPPPQAALDPASSTGGAAATSPPPPSAIGRGRRPPSTGAAHATTQGPTSPAQTSPAPTSPAPNTPPTRPSAGLFDGRE
jgi:serine/threonine protein kinase